MGASEDHKPVFFMFIIRFLFLKNTSPRSEKVNVTFITLETRVYNTRPKIQYRYSVFFKHCTGIPVLEIFKKVQKPSCFFAIFFSFKQKNNKL